ncbi:MAG: hypothetical protein MRQ13_04365 [Candidatus Midichloria sp.]|nr:hypothetical protein [Candidatus Midichloria sp.]
MNLYKINHFGGYNIEIKWGRCPFNYGSRIQYAIFKEDKEEDSMYENVFQKSQRLIGTTYH